MNTLAFTHRSKSYRFVAPTKWNELTARDLVRWANVANSNLSDGDRVRLAIAILYNIPARLLAYLPDHLMVQVAPTLNFLFDENKLSRWVYPSFKIGFRRYYGPGDALSNLTANEFFNYTEALYQQWLQNKNEDILNALIAVLYRQKRRNNINDDARIELTDAGVSLRSRRFQALHLSVKSAILMNYEGCRQYIIANHPLIFKGNLAGKGGKSADLVLALSSGPFGDYNTTGQANLYKFLEHMTRVVEQAEEMKSK